MQAVLQMAYATLKDKARDDDTRLFFAGLHEEAHNEVDLDTIIGFVWLEDDGITDGPLADHAEIIDFLDYWNNSPNW